MNSSPAKEKYVKQKNTPELSAENLTPASRGCTEIDCFGHTCDKKKKNLVLIT